MDPITQEANNSGVQVEIFGQVFNLTNLERGIDPGYILKLAQYIDSKMRAFPDETDTVDRAVYAALDIAHEYHLLLEAKAKEERETSGEEKTAEHPFTEEDRERTRERRQRHYTKRRYEKELLAIVNDESVPAKERHEALFILGRVKGYHRRPTGKR